MTKGIVAIEIKISALKDINRYKGIWFTGKLKRTKKIEKRNNKIILFMQEDFKNAFPDRVDGDIIYYYGEY